jgi:hypothetical protein
MGTGTYESYDMILVPTLHWLCLFLQEFIQADVLVMSRSSFSFVGALLNTLGTVIYPTDRWHQAMPHWLRVEGDGVLSSQQLSRVRC